MGKQDIKKCDKCKKKLGKNNTSGICSKCQKEQKPSDKKEYKVRRILTHFENQEPGAILKPSPTARKLGMHPDTYRETMDLVDGFIIAGIKNVRNSKGFLIYSIKKKEEEEVNIKDDITEIKKKLVEIFKELKKQNKKKK